jgi:hypothetical protein
VKAISLTSVSTWRARLSQILELFESDVLLAQSAGSFERRNEAQG